MYSNSQYSYNQGALNGAGQAQYSQTPDMGTTFGYPTEPGPIPMQQFGGQAGTGQQMPQMPQMPQQPAMPSLVGAAPMDVEALPSTPIMDIQFTQGYLKSQIGARVKVEFLIGTNMLVDREGTLVDVGISYIIIREVDTDDLLLCDIYSIKFVRFYF